MRIRDLTPPLALPAVQIDFGTAYEALLGLATFASAEETLFEGGPAWFQHVRAQLSSECLGALQRLAGPGGYVYVLLLGFVLQSPPPHDVPTFLTYLEQVDPLELRLTLLGYDFPSLRKRSSEAVILRAAQGDQEAAEDLKAAIDDDEWRHALEAILPLGLDETRRLILTILRSWYDDLFRQNEAEIAAVLARDAQIKQKLARTLSVPQFIEQVATGIRYTPEVEFRNVLFIPSVVIRPWLFLSEHRDSKLFCYPVAEESLTSDPDAPPSALLALHKALADESRLRLLRYLSRGPRNLQELTDFLGLAKSTVHGHLVVLRTAGLIHVELGVDKPYRLRSDIPSLCSRLIASYLGADALEI